MQASQRRSSLAGALGLGICAWVRLVQTLFREQVLSRTGTWGRLTLGTPPTPHGLRYRNLRLNRRAGTFQRLVQRWLPCRLSCVSNCLFLTGYLLGWDLSGGRCMIRHTRYSTGMELVRCGAPSSSGLEHQGRGYVPCAASSANIALPLRGRESVSAHYLSLRTAVATWVLRTPPGPLPPYRHKFKCASSAAFHRFIFRLHATSDRFRTCHAWEPLLRVHFLGPELFLYGYRTCTCHHPAFIPLVSCSATVLPAPCFLAIHKSRCLTLHLRYRTARY